MDTEELHQTMDSVGGRYGVGYGTKDQKYVIGIRRVVEYHEKKNSSWNVKVLLKYYSKYVGDKKPMTERVKEKEMRSAIYGKLKRELKIKRPDTLFKKTSWLGKLYRQLVRLFDGSIELENDDVLEVRREHVDLIIHVDEMSDGKWKRTCKSVKGHFRVNGEPKRSAQCGTLSRNKSRRGNGCVPRIMLPLEMLRV